MIVHTKSWQSFSSNLGILQNSSCSQFSRGSRIVMLRTVRVREVIPRWPLRTPYYLLSSSEQSSTFHQLPSLSCPLLSPPCVQGLKLAGRKPGVTGAIRRSPVDLSSPLSGPSGEVPRMDFMTCSLATSLGPNLGHNEPTH